MGQCNPLISSFLSKKVCTEDDIVTDDIIKTYMSFEAALTSCLDALEVGASVESCLATYPEYADRLEPMLGIAVLLFRLSPHLPAGRAFTVPPESSQAFHQALAASVIAFEEGASIASVLAAHPHHAARTDGERC